MLEKSRNYAGEILAPFLILAILVAFNPGKQKMDNKQLLSLLKEWQEYGILIQYRNKIQNQEELNKLMDKTIYAIQIADFD